MERNILFVAYSYPPVGGTGLPGVQRTVKFVKYLHYDHANVLTVRTDCYPNYVDLGNKLELPLQNETIHRTGVFDIFKILLKIKSFLRRQEISSLITKNNSDSSNNINASSESMTSGIWYESENLSQWQRCKDFIFNIFNFPDSSSSWILPAVLKGLKIIKKHKITVIMATGGPWSALTIAYILSKITRVLLVVDFRDPWIENPFHISKGKLLDSFAIRLERAIIKRAQLVSANTEELRHAFLKRYTNIKSDKILTLPNGYDINDFKHIAETCNSKNHAKTNSNLVMAHAGFLYGTRDPSPIIEAIKRIRDSQNKCANIVFWQIGKISLNYDLRERYQDLIEEKRIILIDQLPYKECLKKIAEADVLLNIQPKTKTQVPSKIYDYLCLDLPILTITPLDGALGNMVQRHDFGYIFAPEDVDGISACLKELSHKKLTDGKISANYPNRELFDVRKIAHSLSDSLANIGA